MEKVRKHKKIANYITFENPSYAIDKYCKEGELQVQSPASSLVVAMLDIDKKDSVVL